MPEGRSHSVSMFQINQTVTIFMANIYRRVQPTSSPCVSWLLLASFHLLLCWGDLQAVNGQNSQSANLLPAPAKTPVVISECRINVASDVSLAFEKSGTLEYLVPPGAIVRKDQVIAKLRDSIARASYRIAERESSNDIEIRFAKKAGELAQLKYERAQQAEQRLSGTVTEFELRELRLAAERSLLQLQQAEHQLAIAELKRSEQFEILKSLQITSPFDGFVRAVKKQRGEFLREGEVVVEVVNDEMIRVDGFMNLGDLARVSIGDRVNIYSEQLGHSLSFPGTVDYVDQKIEPVSMKVKISALVQNVDSLLKDGLLVTMEVAPAKQARLSSR